MLRSAIWSPFLHLSETIGSIDLGNNIKALVHAVQFLAPPGPSLPAFLSEVAAVKSHVHALAVALLQL